MTDDLGADDELVLPGLDEKVWTSCPVFSHVHDYALSRALRPDAVLAGAFARQASLMQRGVKLSTGIRRPATSVFYAGLLGVSGDGKSVSLAVAADFIPYRPGMLVPTELDDLRSGRGWESSEQLVAESFDHAELARLKSMLASGGLSSGQGMIEAFMGSVPNRAAVGKTGGRPPNIRTQVRHNAWLTSDEAPKFMAELNAPGSHLGAIFRAMWTGTEAGTMNASAETTRQAEDFCLGVLMAWLPRLIPDFLADLELGTPQRMFWASAALPDLPDELPADPGPLENWTSPPRGKVFLAPEHVRKEMLSNLRARRRPELIHSHRPMMTCKLALHVAVLRGHPEVTDDDWAMAVTLYDYSHSVLVATRDAMAETARHRRGALATERAQNAALTRLTVDSSRTDLQRVMRSIANTMQTEISRVGNVERTATYSALRKGLSGKGRDRDYLFDKALGDLVGTDALVPLEGPRGGRLYRVGASLASFTTNGRTFADKPRKG